MSMRQQQLAMASYLRDPDGVVAPAVEARRLKIYQDLIFNNIENFLSSAIPVLRSLYAEAAWLALLRSFIRYHRCESPYFLEISQEFLSYLMQEYQPGADDPVFMAELAHYEWVELALDVSEEVIPALQGGDPLTSALSLSPLAWVLSYQFPVHRIGKAFQPTEAGPATFLVVYRDVDDQVQFIELNAATARLLELLRDNAGSSGASALDTLAAELGMDTEAVREFGAAQLQEFIGQGVVLVTRS
jgi:hypothetical protein